jgi:acetyl-CoA carboxylase beta subunit
MLLPFILTMHLFAIFAAALSLVIYTCLLVRSFDRREDAKSNPLFRFVWFVRSTAERMQKATLSFVYLVHSLVRSFDRREDARSNPLFRFVYSLVRSIDRREDARSNPLFRFVWFVRSTAERMQEATLSFVSFGSFVGSFDRSWRGCKKQPSLSFRLFVGSFVRS